jgi:hypothetical protein
MSDRHLVPCPACSRHVFSDACACPFCEAVLKTGHSCASLAAPSARRDRLGRAAVMAAAATLLGASSCLGASAYGVSVPWDAGVDRGTQAADASTDADDANAAAAAPNAPAGGGPRNNGR